MRNIVLFFNVLFIFIEIKPWAQAAQIAVDIIGGVTRSIAEAKLKNQEIKRENIELYKSITKSGHNARAQVNNLFVVSNIKEDFSQRVNDYKDNHLLNLDDMAVVISNLYRNYTLLSKQFVRKCIDLTKREKNVSRNTSIDGLIRISVVGIQSAFLDYISLLESYNFESQNLIQIMLTNNLKQNIFQKIEVKNNLIDPRTNLDHFLDKFDSFLDKHDGTIGNLLTNKKLLQDSIILTFNKQTKEILDSLQKIEEKERTKDVLKESISDMTDALDVLKDKLFVTFDNVDESTNNLENFLFKMIFIFQVSMNKLQIIVNAMDKFEDKKSFSESDFLTYLKKEFLKNKEMIEKNKTIYIDEILKYKNPLEFFKKIHHFFLLAKQDIRKFDNASFRSIIRNYTKIIFEQELLYGKFVEKIKDQFSELFYMNGAIEDIEKTIEKIKAEKKELLKKVDKMNALRKQRAQEDARKAEENLNIQQSEKSKKSVMNTSQVEVQDVDTLDEKEILLLNNMTIVNKEKISTGSRKKTGGKKNIKRGAQKGSHPPEEGSRSSVARDTKKHTGHDTSLKKKFINKDKKNLHLEKQERKSSRKKNKGNKS